MASAAATGALLHASRKCTPCGPTSTSKLAPACAQPLEFVPQLQSPDLGARLHHAFDHVFGLGHSRVVVVGTDVPDLEAATIGRALDELQRHQARTQAAARRWQRVITEAAGDTAVACRCAGGLWAGGGWRVLPARAVGTARRAVRGELSSDRDESAFY